MLERLREAYFAGSVNDTPCEALVLGDGWLVDDERDELDTSVFRVLA